MNWIFLFHKQLKENYKRNELIYYDTGKKFIHTHYPCGVCSRMGVEWADCFTLKSFPDWNVYAFTKYQTLSI